jgi:drug/metabolite transporter (DMT)-like permease
VVGFGEGQGEHRFVGDAMVVGAAVLFGAYVMAARGLRDRLPALPYAAAVYGTSGVLLLPVGIVLSLGAAAPPAASWACVLALGLVPTLVGHTLIQRLSRRVPPSIVALVSPGETVFSIAIGVGLGRMPSAFEWVGTALVLVGATIAVTGARR